MKKRKTEIAALTLLLGVLCYAVYDSNIKGSEQEINLTSELFTMKEIKNKEDISKEMLSIPDEELLKEQELVKEENPKEETDTTITSEITSYNYEVNAVAEEGPYYNEIISNQVVNYALQFVGGPYVYGGNSLTEGTDCSGFTKLIYGHYGIYLPRSAPEQAYAGTHISLDNIMPGDIVVSGYDGTVCHASIYIGDGKLVHALNSSVGIVVTSLYIMPIIDVRRVI